MSNTGKENRQHKALKGTRGGLNFYLNHNMENLYPDYSKKNLNIFLYVLFPLSLMYFVGEGKILEFLGNHVDHSN